MYKVQTADGRTVPFRIEKIADSLRRAFEEDCVEYTDSTIDYLAVMVTSDFQRRIQAGLIAAQEIERSVEAVLSRGGYPGVAKAYARLHEGCAQETSGTTLDYRKVVDNYLNINDWRVK